MPAFDFPTLLWWGLPLAGVPILIHLINLLRHRRVPFAAIEFLIASQRKYRTRVLLRQWLLLALRTAAVLGLVAALAQPRWRSSLGALFGGPRAMHVVLLDDSASMRDRSAGGGLGDTSAAERGRIAVARIATDLAAAAQPAELAVARFTALAVGLPAAAGGTDGAGAGAPNAAPRDGAEPAASGAAPPAATLVFDLPLQVPTPAAAARLTAALERRAVTLLAMPPAAALEAILPLVTADSGSERVVWLVSDFRAHDWGATSATVAAVRRLAEAGVALRLIDCAATAAPGSGGNLSIERLEVVGGVPAAGVLVPLEVTVRNDGQRSVQDVAVALREDGGGRPGVRIAEIAPGGTASVRFDVRFAAAGSHVVEAELPPDVLDADNARATVVEVADRAAVLVIDGEPRGDGRSGDAFYVTTALAPGAGAATGVLPRVEPPRALATLDLAAFDSIWLLDVPRLDPPEIAALEAYARDGGGVVFFAGPRTQADQVNRLLHRDGEGLYPVGLAGAVELSAKPAGDPVPDIVVEDHPVVAVLSGRRNPLLDAVRIDRVMAAVPERPADGETAAVRRLLSLRTGAPLVVERPFGRGTVVAVLSTAAPVWNNWARGNPSWVVVLLELESHLARGRRQGVQWTVGDAVTLRLDDAATGTEVDVAVPPDGHVVRQAATPTPAGPPEIRLASADAAGAYVARWLGLDGAERRRAVAVNVDPVEGRLERIGRERIAAALPGVALSFEDATALDTGSQQGAGTSLARPLLVALLAMLLGEQLLALLAGYHPAAGRGPRRGTRDAAPGGTGAPPRRRPAPAAG
jgi:hypothetical protein